MPWEAGTRPQGHELAATATRTAHAHPVHRSAANAADPADSAAAAANPNPNPPATVPPAVPATDDDADNTLVSTHPAPTTAILAAAPPEKRRRCCLGEPLFLLVSRLQPELAGKITGMLLDERASTEVLNLLESPESLSAKVDEAMAVLRQHGVHPTDGRLYATPSLHTGA